MVVWRLRLFHFSPFTSVHLLKIGTGIFGALILFSFFYALFWRAPRPFPNDVLVSIEKGDSISAIARNFEEARVVRSSFWLKTFIIMMGGEKAVAGDYYFPKGKSVWSVAKMIHRGEFGLIAIRVTIHEGTSSYGIAEELDKTLPSFNANDFLDKVESEELEGYLFPDTYFFMQNTTANDVILMMRENFAREIKPYEADILKFKKPLEEVVIMASILEGEARTIDQKRMVAGILWKRLRMGMPLQVDAVFKYYNGKNSYTLTSADLKDDHDYNTYTNKGLPPTAINNPGIDSLRAAITPTQSDYLYFLSDRQGNMHYAKNFEQHKRNKEAYID